MEKPKFLEDIVNRLMACLPFDLKATKSEVEKQFHDILRQGLRNKLDLVTREEFDAQVKVLAKTRKKLDELEKKIREMEEKTGEKME